MNTMTADAIENIRETFNFSIEKFPLSGPDGMKTVKSGLKPDTRKALTMVHPPIGIRMGKLNTKRHTKMDCCMVAGKYGIRPGS